MTIVFLISLSVVLAMVSYRAGLSDFSVYDVLILGGWVLAVFAVEAILLLMVRLAGRRWLLVATASILLAYNALSLHLIFNPGFIGLPFALKAGAVAVFAVAALLVFNMNAESRRARRISVPIAVAAAVASLAHGAWLTVDRLDADLTHSMTAGKRPALAGDADGGLFGSKIQPVAFERRDNVYLISFDSLISRPLAQKMLGIEGTAMNDLLDEEFRRFPNFFVEAVPTRFSLNSVLALDKEYFFTGDRRAKVSMFQGRTPSPLLEVFHRNGYESNTLFNSTLFGVYGGPYVDHYHVNSNFSVCQFIPPGDIHLAFFGYCSLSQKDFWTDAIGELGLRERPEAFDFLLRRMAIIAAREKPQILVAHIYAPGHTEADYDHADPAKRADFVRQYVERSTVAAADLGRLLDFLRTNDPNAIFMTYGDHGTWISRRSAYGEDPEFFVTDRYAVYGGVYPPDTCPETLGTPDAKQFYTTLQAIVDLMRCLSGGEEVLTGPVDDRLWLDWGERKIEYGEFIHE